MERLLTIVERFSNLQDGVLKFFTNFSVVFGVEIILFFGLIFFELNIAISSL